MQRKINRQGGSKKVFSVDLERFRFGFVSFSNRVLARCKKKKSKRQAASYEQFQFFFRKKFFCVKVMRLPRNSLSLSERIKSSSNIFYTPSDILWRTDTHTLVHTHAQCSIGRSTRHTQSRQELRALHCKFFGPPIACECRANIQIPRFAVIRSTQGQFGQFGFIQF